MTIQMVASTIQLILAPVVMVSACALLLTGLLGRYTAVDERLRLMTRERLELALGPPLPPAVMAERLQELDRQIPDALRRHRRLRDAVLSLYSAVLVFIVCMLIIALAAATSSDWASTVALLVFLAGTGVLLAGIVFAAMEVRISDTAIHDEVGQVSRLPAGPSPTEER